MRTMLTRTLWVVGSVVCLAACSGQAAPSSSATSPAADAGSGCPTTVAAYCASNADPLCGPPTCPNVTGRVVYVQQCGALRSVVLAGTDFSTNYYFDVASGDLVAVV